MASQNEPTPEGIFSILDTDLYKLTMQCGILKFYPDIKISYKLTNRTPQMRLSREAYDWLRVQIDKLQNLRVTAEEIDWLQKTCPYLHESYLQYLRDFQFRPSEQVKTAFHTTNNDDKSTPGDLELSVNGLWLEIILYETPLLALTSEAYFRFVDRDWDHTGQIEAAQAKGKKLIDKGCVFSEFGSRRRRDYRTHEMVLQGLIQAQEAAAAASNSQNTKGKLTGTSNVHFAMKFGISPIGTVAHEWFMAIAAITDDYAHANERALEQWVGTYGRGVLSIALTDTFGTPNFLRAFVRPAPKSGEPGAQIDGDGGPSYAKIFAGVRQDSGDPLEFLKTMKEFYASQKITEKKSIVYSDSLNVDRCIQYKEATEKAGLVPSFGVGTFFTNDFRRKSKEDEKSVPLNIVIKPFKVQGRPAIKLSDDQGKNMGDDGFMREVKEQVGYTDRTWEGLDEAHRWDENEG